MKRLFAIASLAIPLTLIASSSFAINCTGGRIPIVVNDGTVVGMDRCAGASNTSWPSWLIGLFM